MQILPVNSTTGLLSGLLAHWVRKVLYSLAKQKLLLALGVRLADFSRLVLDGALSWKAHVKYTLEIGYVDLDMVRCHRKHCKYDLQVIHFTST